MHRSCPFCGGSDLELLSLEREYGRLWEGFVVRCWKCKAEGPYASTASAAVRLWDDMTYVIPRLSGRIVVWDKEDDYMEDAGGDS